METLSLEPFVQGFAVLRRSWKAGDAIEINLRKGGTTHPFLTLQFLTDGTYDPEAAVFTAPGARRRATRSRPVRPSVAP